MLQSCQTSWGDTSKKFFLELLTVITLTSIPHSAVKQSYGSFAPGRCWDVLLLTAGLRGTNERSHQTVTSDLSSCNSFRKQWGWITMEFHEFQCAQTCQVISIIRDMEMIWGNLQRCGIQQLPDFFLCSALFACAVLDWALCPRREMTQGPDFFLSELMLAETTLEIIWAEFCPCSTHRSRFCAEFCPCQAHRSRLFFPIYLSLPHLLFCIPPSILCFFSLSQTNNRCLKSKDLLSGCTIWMDIKYIDLDTPLFLSILSI